MVESFILKKKTISSIIREQVHNMKTDSLWKQKHKKMREKRTKLAQVNGDKIQSEDKGLLYVLSFSFLHKSNGNQKTKI